VLVYTYTHLYTCTQRERERPCELIRMHALVESPIGATFTSDINPGITLPRVTQDRNTWICKAALEGPHRRTIRSVAWSPCGNFLASAAFDSTTCIWDRRGGEFECVTTLEGHENEVKACAWAPQGGLLATCGRDKSVWVWEANYDDEYDVVAVLNEHTQDVKSVVWHPTRSLLLSCSYDDTLKLYEDDGDEWACIDTLTGHKSSVWSASFNATGTYFVSCGADQTVMFWKSFAPANQTGIATDGTHSRWKPVCTLSGDHTRPIYSVDWSKTSNLVAAAGGDNAIRIYGQSPTEENSFSLLAQQLQAHTRDVNCVCWHPDGSLLATAGDDDVVCIWAVTE
jgi:WD40 repeat protein